MKIKQIPQKYKLPVFLNAVIFVAFILVIISMQMYYGSGAAQLDLSRPEYVSVRSQINKADDKKKSFDTQGEVTEKVLEEFLNDYKLEAKKATDANAFSNDVLSDEALGIN